MEASNVEGSVKVDEKPRVQGAAANQCSVCLEAVVVDAAKRSVAKLKCGHYFHLDCIGSAYNAKGIMQCPNCRDIEDGQWLYANGGGLPDDIPFEEMGYEDGDYDIYGGVSEFLFSHEHIGTTNWCPYPGSSYSHFSVSLGGIDPSASGCPDLLVNVVCGNLPPSFPFGPGNDSRPSRYHLGYDSMIGALQHHVQNESLGAEVAGIQGFTSPDGRQWSHHILPMPSSMSSDTASSSRLIPVNERSCPYRMPTDTGAQQRTADVSNASTIWSEPPAQNQSQGGRGPVPPARSNRNALGTSSSWSNRSHGGAGRTGHSSDSHGQLQWAFATPSGVQDGRASMRDTNWQGDQGIPWSRDGFSGNPWAVREPEYLRWDSVASSSSHAGIYHGVHGLGNGAFRTPTAFSGYPSAFQHDGSGDVGSQYPRSTTRPR
ncbi:E3 ubiquitin-protein ligase RFI2 [Cryptomeria japonica]|uniref:E3 ubiquitin-protein ligase RFI2 n=1 Tax=Cryptomeria japonica TaxID=3369 RepID=UPI0027DA0637|nr:E3 ubiquitin-protein ligase RFI2 [Cryptomeria japonica]XP_059074531.1 E3 ubiquitin-protein ligase RFI2 [Cryptomeria japonica]